MDRFAQNTMDEELGGCNRQVLENVDSEKNLMLYCTDSGPGNQPGSEEAAAWRENASRLAEFALTLLVNRHDAFGRYRPLEQREQRKCLVERSAVTADLLERHFRGASKGELVGLHCVGPDGKCRWVAIDIDNHGSCEETAAINQAAAFAIARKAEAAGLKPLLLDSDGSGGYHVWVIFENPILNEVAYRLARWLIEGSDAKVESFPKRAKHDASRLGPWLRLPGVHHSKSCYTRVWNGSAWMSGNAAIDLICGHQPSDAASIPAVVAASTTSKAEVTQLSNSFAIHALKQRLMASLNRHPVAARLNDRRREELAIFLMNFPDLTETGNDGWMARCPSHDDSSPSLKIDVKLDGTILLHCFAGCECDEIVEAVGVDIGSLFDRERPQGAGSLQPAESFEPVPSPANPALAEMHLRSLEAIDHLKLLRLAAELGVSPESLVQLQVGWDVSTGSYVFPERNGVREICGLIRRKGDKKLAVKGSKRGLTVPADFRLDIKELIICEGASDTAAALTLRHPAIGTPNVGGGFADLAVLLRGLDRCTDMRFVPDNDPQGHAVEHTRELAMKLADYLKRDIKIDKLPGEYKDIRDFLNRRTLA